MTVYIDVADRLIGVLRDAAGTQDLDYGRRPEPLPGGFWAELMSFSLARPPDGWPAELVARLMPDPGAARKETIVQRAVAAAGFPTPRVRVAGSPRRRSGPASCAGTRPSSACAPSPRWRNGSTGAWRTRTPVIRGWFPGRRSPAGSRP